MDDVVFGLPHIIVGSEKINRQTCHVIDPFIPAETTVDTIMHHIKSNGRCESSQNNTFDQRQPDGRSKENKMDIYKNETYNQCNCLNEKFVITGRRFANFFEVVTYSFL